MANKKSKLDKAVEANRKKSMTKKALAEYNKAQRSVVLMNTGTRTHKSAKDYNRQQIKHELRKAVCE